MMMILVRILTNNTNRSLESRLRKYDNFFWLKNYVKTVSSSTLIGTGIGLLVTGELTRMHNKGISDAELIIGTACIILAFIITLLLDLYLKRKEKEKLHDVEEYIDERAEQIASELVLKHLKEFEK